jgi:glycosyltransferase involved in cell wall biosynthesis
MRIAVNTRFLLNDYLEGYGYFIHETLSRITRANPDHEFLFLFDRSYDQRFLYAENVKPLVVGPPARHPLLWKLWYDFRVPAVLKKYKADLFLSCDGFCSLNTAVPQCLVLHDLAFLHFPGFTSRSHLLYHKRYVHKFLQKARTIATVSEFSKKDIIANYPVDPSKIRVIYSGVKEIFQPLGYEQRQPVMEKYTGGKAYFIYTGAIHPRKNLFNLLKAFSLFKKRLQSNMKLVIAGRLAWNYEHFTESLKTYKYRDDVILTGYVDEKELALLTASAYAMVYPSLLEGFGVPVLEAMQAGVPVISSLGTAMEETGGDAALYADPHSYEDIGEKMMLIYKDENFRKQLIQKGLDRSRLYGWDKTARLLWELILKTAGEEGKW